MITAIPTLLFLFVSSAPAAIGVSHNNQTSNSERGFTVEAGTLFTRNFSISGFEQPNASDGWKGTAVGFRVEHWNGGGQRFKQGWTLQPLDITYKDSLKADFTVKAQTFQQGDNVRLRYQFPSIRWTGNRRVMASRDGRDELRFGGTVIVRYADVSFQSADKGFHDRNLIFFPLFNVEGTKHLSRSWSFFGRVDALPSPTGGLFLDGLVDGILGIRQTDIRGKTTDIGLRLILGGYDPKKSGEYANRINYSALVIRRRL